MNTTRSTTARIVIAGGGFGGFYAARSLERRLRLLDAEVTLVSDVNFFLYTPLLPGAAAGTLEPRHVVVPMREELRRTELILGTITGADPADSVVHVQLHDSEPLELRYDHLIVAVGSVSRVLPIPGLVEHGRGFKTLAHAIALRNRMLETLEIAEATDDSAGRVGYLTYVFVGAGYAGLEGIAELQDFVADVVDLYPRCREHGARFVLVEARERVMPEVSPKLAAFAERQLCKRGIEVRTNTTVAEVTERSVTLSDGEVMPCRTVAWTAGVRPHPVVERLGLPLGGDGRVVTGPDLLVEGQDSVWAIGDAAAVPDPARPGEPCPPTAQHAIRQGTLAGRNIAAALGRGRRRDFGYKTLGVFVDMGRHQAVAMTMGVRWRGFPAWFLARTYHMALMPGLKRKLRLVADWTVALLFQRDASELGQLGHPPALTGAVTAETPPAKTLRP